ncbi:hypothetical protein FKZ05_13200 [Enterococcus faecalis]|nr:hypothetical protein FKZ05_13200 [Enterococcus faecalis]TQB23417.1 hypothetical protein FKZ16_15305 [Enterococcus faecalis]
MEKKQTKNTPYSIKFGDRVQNKGFVIGLFNYVFIVYVWVLFVNIFLYFYLINLLNTIERSIDYARYVSGQNENSRVFR